MKTVKTLNGLISRLALTAPTISTGGQMLPNCQTSKTRVRARLEIRTDAERFAPVRARAVRAKCSLAGLTSCQIASLNKFKFNQVLTHTARGCIIRKDYKLIAEPTGLLRCAAPPYVSLSSEIVMKTTPGDPRQLLADWPPLSAMRSLIFRRRAARAASEFQKNPSLYGH